jgi:hypothetical protein
MTTDDFKKFKAIIFGDKCRDADATKFIADTKNVWSPAITGNVAILGIEDVEPLRNEFSYPVIQKNMINFAASGAGTGLYYAIPCHDVDTVRTLDELSHFGNISVEYNPTNRVGGSLTNIPHLVASSPGFITLTNDSSINVDFEQDVSNIFIDFPTSGPGGFEVAVITTKTGSNDGVRAFADGSSGAPFVITRGATPVGCTNGIYEGQFGEECDPKSALLSNTTDVCNQSCKCLKNFPGVCPPPPPVKASSSVVVASGAPASSGSAVASHSAGGSQGGSPTHGTGSGSAVGTGSSYVYPTASGSSGTEVVGIEIIFVIDIVEICPAGQTGKFLTRRRSRLQSR